VDVLRNFKSNRLTVPRVSLVRIPFYRLPFTDVPSYSYDQKYRNCDDDKRHKHQYPCLTDHD